MEHQLLTNIQEVIQLNPLTPHTLAAVERPAAFVLNYLSYS